MSTSKGISFRWVWVLAVLFSIAGAWWLMVWPLISPPAPPIIAKPVEIIESVAPDPLAPAKVALAAGQFRKAVAILNGYTKHHPHDWRGWSTLSQAYWDEKRHHSISVAKAISAYQRALENIDAKDVASRVEVLDRLAYIYVRNERMAQARQTYEKLVEVDPDQSRHINYLMQIDEIDLDLGVYQPDENAFYNDAGEVLGPIGPKQMRTNQNFEKARHTLDPVKQAKWYRLAAITDPQMPQAFLNLGIALALQRKFEEAIQPLLDADRVYRVDKKRNPQAKPYGRALGWLTLCYVETGKLKKASQTVRKIPTDETDGIVRDAILRLAIGQGHAQQVLPRVQLLLNKLPEDVPLQCTRALALKSLEHNEQANAALQRLIDQIPPDHMVYRFQLEHWRELQSREARVPKSAVN